MAAQKKYSMKCFDLFVNLDANDEQLDFPSLFASGRNGYAGDTPEVREGDLAPLFDKIVEHVPEPDVNPDADFKFLVTLLDRDNFVGRILTGKVESGKIDLNAPIHAIDMDGNVVETGRATKIMAFRGLERVPVESAKAGDIISLAGLTEATVANTICDPSVTEPIAAQPIDPPTLSMNFAVNDSPMAGREGDKVTSRIIRDRLLREAESNVAIKITESEEKDSFEVAGRGELQLGVSLSKPCAAKALNSPFPARAFSIVRKMVSVRNPMKPWLLTLMTNIAAPSFRKCNAARPS